MIVFSNDEDEVLEIPVGLGPNVTPISAGSDWILNAKLGNIRDLSLYSLPEPTRDYQYTALFENSRIIKAPDLSSWTQITTSYGASNMFALCEDLSSKDLNLSNLTTISGNYAAQRMFVQCRSTSFNSVNLSGLTTISGSFATEAMFHVCHYLFSVDLSSLTTISGNYAADSMFNGCNNLSSADLSSLTTISGDYAANRMFNACNSLRSMDLGNLTAINSDTGAYEMFRNCGNLITLKSHPNIWSYNSFFSIGKSLPNIRNLTFTALTQQDKNVYLNDQMYLTSDSVLSVLTHLNPDYPGTCSFYSSGLIVTDDDQGSLQTAYNAAVNAGWTINNLTIIPYS